MPLCWLLFCLKLKPNFPIIYSEFPEYKFELYCNSDWARQSQERNIQQSSNLREVWGNHQMIILNCGKIFFIFILFLPAAIIRIAAWPVFEPGAHSVTFYVTFYNPQVNRVCQVRILYSENVSQLAPGDVTFSLSNIVDALPAISCVWRH